MKNTDTDSLDIATLPLSDGRKMALPLLALAEVQQIQPGEDGLGSIKWRGLNLAITSLEEFCGLQAPADSAHTTVGIFRAAADSKEPFRALAFCGLAAYRCIVAGELKPAELPETGCFCAAAEMDGEIFLVPDLPALMFSSGSGQLH